MTSSAAERVFSLPNVRRLILLHRVPWTASLAVILGRRDVFELFGHMFTDYSPFTMDIAAVNGHLGTVQWLHENRSEGCTHWAMTSAAADGHLDTVRWLHEHRSEGCSRLVLQWAADSKHSDVEQFLREHRPWERQ